jgi:hypothetical protein
MQVALSAPRDVTPMRARRAAARQQQVTAEGIVEIHDRGLQAFGHANRRALAAP